MFPLGTVLFPYMPLQLRIFEERYVTMLSTILKAEPAEFGVVLIEQGQEVGGGERRFDVGTVAQVTQLESADGFIAVLAQGERRFEVAEWLSDELYPRADVRELAPLEWHDDLLPLRVRAEQEVRRTLAIASEFTDQAWAADVEISDDPVQSSWQLAGIAPLGSLDQVTLLQATSVRQLLESVIELTFATQQTLTAWPGDGDGL